MDAKRTIAVAQIAPALGAVERNLDLWLQRIEEAVRAGAQTIVFPELGLTGYFLRDMVPDVALSVQAKLLQPLLEKSGEIEIIGGFVEEAADGQCYNAAMCLRAGRVEFVHRKVYLPTYGMFDEQRYFAAGDRLRAFPYGGAKAAILLCEDTWHLSSGYVVCCDGALILFVLASSPARGISEAATPASTCYWELLNQIYSSFFGVYVVFANRVGCEDGVSFWGGSEVVEPGGRVVAKAGYFEPQLLLAEVNAQVLRRERRTTPLLRDEKLWLVLRELARVHNERAKD